MTTLARGDIYDQNNNLVLSSDDENYNEKLNKIVNATGGGATSSSVFGNLQIPPSGEIAEIYEILAPMAENYANAQTERIGQAQQSMGPLAAAAMGESKTAGLGNYTYNRLVRPQVDVMRDELLVQGYASQLNQLLADALRDARNRYNKRTNSTTNKTTNNNGVTVEDEVDEKGVSKDNSGAVVKEKKFAGSGNPNTKLSDEEKAKKAAEWAKLYRSIYGPTF